MKNSTIDYYEGFQHCLDNALNHLKVAELSKTVSFGIAHAHTVLASEEAVKAIILFNIYFDNDVLADMKDFQLYFSNHKYKHETIRSFELGSLLIEKMLMIQMEPFIKDKNGSSTPEDFKAKKTEGFKNLIQWLKELSDENNKQTTLETNDQWWKQAESYKKNGFYVNILMKKGGWDGPHKCSKNQYDKGRKIVLEFIQKVQSMEEYMKNPDVIEMYWDLKKHK